MHLPNFLIYNIGQILKLVHKKNCKNIDLYHRPVIDIGGHIYNSIAGGIIVQELNRILETVSIKKYFQ
jgi:hypothetical protein